MSDFLQVDTLDVGLVGRRVQNVAEKMAERTANLRASLGSIGECWGTDEPGCEFAKTYEPDAKTVLSAGEELADNLRQMGRAIVDTADAMTAQDQQGARNVRNADAHPAVAPSPEPAETPVTAAQPGAGTTPATSAVPAVPDARPGTTAGPAATEQPTAPTQQDPDAPAPSGANSAPAVPQGKRPTAPPSGAVAPPARTMPFGGGGPAANAPGSLSDRPARTAPEGMVRAFGAGSAAAASSSAPGTIGRGPTTGGKVFPPPSDTDEPGTNAGPRRPDNNGRATKRSTDTDEPVPPRERATSARDDLAERAARHGAQVVGLDLVDVADWVWAEIADAVDDVLGVYPWLRVDRVGLADLDEDEWLRVQWDRARGDGAAELFTDAVLLAAAAGREPERFVEAVETSERSGHLIRGSQLRPVYSAMVRGFGHALDAAGGFTARPSAQRWLISSYAGGGAVPHPESLATVVGGFRQWRDQLSGRCFHRGRFDAGTAMSEAFTEVWLHGETASPPAQVLNELLVGTARPAQPEHRDGGPT